MLFKSEDAIATDFGNDLFGNFLNYKIEIDGPISCSMVMNLSIPS